MTKSANGTSADNTGSPAIPQWLESLRLADNFLAEGYESTPAEFRVALKTGLAFSQAFYGEHADFSLESHASSLNGFKFEKASLPAPFVLAAFPADYASAPRLAAALMAARLAGTRHVAAASLGGRPTSPVCAALELAGVEDIFALGPQEALNAANEIYTAMPGARLVVLGAWRESAAALWRAALACPLPCFAEQRPPKIKIQKNCGHNLEIISWSHPDALKKSGPRPDVFYCAAESEPKEAPLALGPGLEACWVHPGLDPGFFRLRRIRAGTF